ncbi:uncharacterized protein LOC111087461 [Limulus polyphemus]|uniref:Uncharacterized protein LOC111087461 n=1 Tax=Limulus polyphemus TaxID=6850 RepID=A0ABM1T1V3_LIMPO|nr:uncharacterized protein LOC111087461 [Limulus polyphemus]
MFSKVIHSCSAVSEVLNRCSGIASIRLVFRLMSSEAEKDILKFLRKHQSFTTFSLGSNSAASIQYVDTNQPGPAVLLITGIKSEFYDFGGLIQALSRKGLRVLAPNLPGFGRSFIRPSSYFRHSPEEVANVLRRFLVSINVPRVDLMLAHSAGIFPALTLISDNPQFFRSMVLMCPPGLRPWRGIKPLWLFRGGSYCFSKPILKLAVLPLFRWIHKRVKMECSDDTVKVNVHTIGNIDFLKASKCADDIVANNTPVLLAFSTNDPYIEKAVVYRTACRWGLRKEDFWCYDDDGILITEGKNPLSGNHQNYIVGLSFSRGRHSIFLKYQDILVEAMMNMLNYVTIQDVSRESPEKFKVFTKI